MSRIPKRTKKDYAALFSDPGKLFGADTETILWPNGQKEIWLKERGGGAGATVTAGKGPHGFCVRVKAHVGTREATLSGMRGKHYDPVDVDDIREVEFCFMGTDAKAQAFKRWYQKRETDADVALLGESYRRRK